MAAARLTVVEDQYAYFFQNSSNLRVKTYHVLTERRQRLCIGDLEQRGISMVAQNFERWNSFYLMAVVEDHDRARRVSIQRLDTMRSRYELGVASFGGVARRGRDGKRGEREQF